MGLTHDAPALSDTGVISRDEGEESESSCKVIRRRYDLNLSVLVEPGEPFLFFEATMFDECVRLFSVTGVSSASGVSPR